MDIKLKKDFCIKCGCEKFVYQFNIGIGCRNICEKCIVELVRAWHDKKEQ